MTDKAAPVGHHDPAAPAQAIPAQASLLGKESILSVAESIGQISDDVASAMAPEIEFRLRDIVQEARKFMLAAKRDTLTTADINYALRLRNVEVSALRAADGKAGEWERARTPAGGGRERRRPRALLLASHVAEAARW